MDFSRHPCFNDSSRHAFARLHVPVAPKCNIQCAFCNRQFDCVNESRPGVSSAILSPQQAAQYVDKMLQRDPRIAVVGIAGPGDPFANAAETLKTLRLVRAAHPDMLLCVATNGLALPPHVEALAELKVSHVSITINALVPEVAAPIYSWVRDGHRVYRGFHAASLMISRQLKAVAALKRAGLVVKINTIIVPGVNDARVGELSAELARLGADIQNCIALHPVAGTAMETILEPTSELMDRVRAEAAHHLPQMRHCARCRADAAGLIGESLSNETISLLRASAARPVRPLDERPYVAVATQEGLLVNQHLGHAEEFWIFKPQAQGFALVEKRPAPEEGGGSYRWTKLAGALHDCRAVLACAAGAAPQMVLDHHGLRVIVAEGLIDALLADVYSGRPVRSPARSGTCGSACSGRGTGCG